jgi:hypothetical protein
MLKVERILEYLRITGYPDGSEWLFLPTRPADRGFGTAGPTHIWTCHSTGLFELFDANTRRRTTIIELGALSPAVTHIPLTVSRDGQSLFILQGLGSTETHLKIVDIASGKVTAAHAGLPPMMWRAPIERHDGRLLLAQRGASLILLDPTTGTREDSQVSGNAAPPGFIGASPSGRYWLRFDQTSLPVRQDSAGMIGRLLGKQTDEEPRYGLTVQVWEAFPLRFLHRTVVAWLTVKELPDETSLNRMRGKPPAISSRRVLWNVIAQTTAAAGDSHHAAAPLRSAYPPGVATDDGAWQVVERNVEALARGWVLVVGWQPDESAFWVSTNNFLTCVGIDGTISPRLYTERRGLEGGTIRPIAARYQDVMPLAGRKARVIYQNGEALFDGAATTKVNQTVAVPTARDHWQPRGGPDDPEARGRSAAFRRVAELNAQRRQIVVPLADWSESEVIRAIDALAELAAEGEIHRRAVGRVTTILFEIGGAQLHESQFFPEVGLRVPAAAPAIRRLVERFVDASGDHDFLFAAEEGPGVLAHAVKVLGVLDLSSIPTLERYGRLVDAEHEYFFAGETVRAVIAAHGWTDEIVDFVFWVLVRNYYNTLQEYGPIWQSWGLRDAVVQRNPRALAQHLVTELADIIRWVADPSRYGAAGLEKLAREIPQPHEPWARAFFDELEKAFNQR